MYGSRHPASSPAPATAGGKEDLDRQNRHFWDELCGTSLARSLGISDTSPRSLARFDHAYLSLYPYLGRYLAAHTLRGARALEIGLGYGTVGQVLATRARRYVGVDVAAAPVALMRRRLQGSAPGQGTALEASALDLPFPSGAFDVVVSIGCLHHTGNLPRAIAETHRVLAPGGRAIVMLYHRRSLRLLAAGALGRLTGLTHARPGPRPTYDRNADGEAAPHTDFVTRADVRRLFRRFARVRVESQNCDALSFRGRLILSRERLLRPLGRTLGLDLYVVATR